MVRHLIHGSFLALGTALAVLAGCSDSPTQPIPDAVLVSASASTLLVTASAMMTVGRTVHPTFAVSAIGIQGRYYRELPELPARVSLVSSNEQAVTIQSDGSIRGVAPGQATTTATVAGDTSRLLVDVLAGYPLRVISASEKYNVYGVNDAGDVVAIQTGGLNLLRQGDAVTDLGACTPNDINNAGAVARTVSVSCGVFCTTVNAGVFQNGALRLLTEAPSSSVSGISESGIVFGQAGDRTTSLNSHVMVWDASGVTYLSPDRFWLGSTFRSWDTGETACTCHRMADTRFSPALADDSWSITRVAAVSHARMIAAQAQNAAGTKAIVLIDIGATP